MSFKDNSYSSIDETIKTIKSTYPDDYSIAATIHNLINRQPANLLVNLVKLNKPSKHDCLIH